MDDDGWEEQAGSRRAHPAVLVLGGLLAVVVLALLARPTGDGGAGGGQALEGRLPADLAVPSEAPPAVPPRPSPAPAPERSPSPAPAADGTPQPTAFDPSGRWEPVSRPPFSGPLRGPGAWDGRRVVLWPGEGTGGVYAPDVDAWAALPPAPVTRSGGWSAVWSGEEVLFWGGRDADGTPAGDGAALRSDRLAWRALPPAPVAGRSDHAATWGGGRMWVWGGIGEDGVLADGASYDPATDAWEVLPPAPLSPRAGATAVWTGDSLLVWGGWDVGEPAPGEQPITLVDGARYRPGEGWTSIADAPTAFRGTPTAVWVPPTACPGPPGCDVLLVWGTPAPGLHLRDGHAYHRTSDSWTPLPNLLSQTRHGAAGAWTGQAAVVWGGTDWRGGPPRRDGFVYDPATQRWVQVPDLPVDPGPHPTVVVAGEELLVIGDAADGHGVGGRYPLAGVLADR